MDNYIGCWVVTHGPDEESIGKAHCLFVDKGELVWIDSNFNKYILSLDEKGENASVTTENGTHTFAAISDTQLVQSAGTARYTFTKK